MWKLPRWSRGLLPGEILETLCGETRTVKLPKIHFALCTDGRRYSAALEYQTFFDLLVDILPVLLLDLPMNKL